MNILPQNIEFSSLELSFVFINIVWEKLGLELTSYSLVSVVERFCWQSCFNHLQSVTVLKKNYFGNECVWKHIISIYRIGVVHPPYHKDRCHQISVCFLLQYWLLISLWFHCIVNIQTSAVQICRCQTAGMNTASFKQKAG